MTPVFPDTSPETERVLFAMLRDMSAWRKLEMVAQLNQTVRELALAGLQTRYSDATQGELQRHLADILLGDVLTARVYGPAPAEPTVQIDMNEIMLKVEAESVAQRLTMQ